MKGACRTLSIMSRIEQIRERTGWTQLEIAQRLGVNRSTVTRWQAKGDEIPERCHRLLDLLELSTVAAGRRTRRRPTAAE